jgi:hypothetical protein
MRLIRATHNGKVFHAFVIEVRCEPESLAGHYAAYIIGDDPWVNFPTTARMVRERGANGPTLFQTYGLAENAAIDAAKRDIDDPLGIES